MFQDKNKVYEKFIKANKTSNYITKHISKNNILDINDLNKYFLNFRKDLIKNKNEDLQYIYFNSKEKLTLRFHQELITQKTSNLIEKDNKTFLWGCKCRSGKTFMFGGIIIKEFNKKNKLNVLIITPAPTETIPQFTDDLFYKYKEFDKFKIHQIDGSDMINNIILDKNNIFIMSKQLLQKYINDKTIIKIKNLNLDIIGFDENHFTGTTELSKDILMSYSCNNTVKIYMTATYNKPVKEWNIINECKMFWDIEDEQICKSILNNETNIEKLKDKHGHQHIETTIEYYKKMGINIYDMFKNYEKMPELHLITNLFDQQRYEIIKQNLKINVENKMGFCFDTLFGLTNSKKKFIFDNEVKIFLRYISGSQKEKDGNKTIFTRIDNICSKKETRKPFTQIWFLPSNNINDISLCLTELINEDLVLKKYDVICINRKNKELAKDIKDEINKREIEAKNKGSLGLIIIAGNMLTLGITLNLCDLVIIMNNSLSSDKVLQQMYRCMTESHDKKIGFVVDMNISRVLNTCINYSINNNNQNIKEKIEYLIEHNLINIDVDMMFNKKINTDILIKKLMDIWKEDPINSFRTLLKKLDDDYEEFDNVTQKLVNNTFTKNINDNNITAKIIFKDNKNELQYLQTGKEIIIDTYENKENEKNDEPKEVYISFTKDVLPFIIPLTCILTIENNNLDFVIMLNNIKENPILLEIFDDQCLIWWNKKDLIYIIEDIIKKYFNKKTNTYNISIQIKMSLKSLIDKPKELLELINDCLKPKDIEKKKYGEVFTPIKIINEMLDQLPKEVWSDKNLKWLDPAAGMGNFPVVVFLRLMKSLKNVITDKKKRKKHILEKMLYMCEINKKNVMICKQIFNVNNKYKLNLYQGDSLKLNFKDYFKVDKFDIIMGNPPYNKGGIRSSSGKHLGKHNQTIWTKFVEMSFKLLKENGYLAFINPLTWLKKSHSLHNIILEKHIIWIKLWDNIKSLSTINGKIPISLFVLHNKLNINKKKTEIISEIQSKKVMTISNEYLNKIYSIPLAYHSIFNKLIKFRISYKNCKNNRNKNKNTIKI